jgi:ParB-like chromosome segregation protein Spo0J
MTTRKSKNATPSAAPSSADSSGSATRHPSERYEVTEIHRSQISAAEYNPRHIGEQARRRLKRAIERVGLIGPIVWNKRSGRVVGGHQRLKILDQLAGGQQYTLSVAAVDMDDAQERAANLLLNNPEAQGEWDFAKLGEMLKDPELDLEGSGMGSADVYKIIGDAASDAVLDEIAERIDHIRERDEETLVSNAENQPDYYLVVVFRDNATRERFCERVGLDNNRYVNGEDLDALVPDPERND